MLSRHLLMVIWLIWLACFMASADDTACALQKAVGKPKIRDNYVCFWHNLLTNDTVQSVEFEVQTHAITQGQPYEGVSSDDYCLDVRAGRHGSEWVANDFNDGITWDNAFGLFADDPLPEELNFAIFGTMNLTIDNTTLVCPEMRLAQGHQPLNNNWWIAGTECYHQDHQLESVGLICPCGDTNVRFGYVNQKTSNDNVFSVITS